jgi:hypothetical protein
MSNEKANARHIGSNTNFNHEKTMIKHTPTQNKFQFDLFVTEQPKKVLETIHCCDCHNTRPLDGYRFKLMPLCSDCRTERSLEILSNRIERRAKK